MHPDSAFRLDDPALHRALLDEVAFGMAFRATPDGPRVAHVPLVPMGKGAVQFHLSRGNALTKHLDGETALLLVNGPDAYVSPRWYADRSSVPTWNYVALELEGRVRKMDRDGLDAHLHELIARHEGRIETGERWTPAEVETGKWNAMLSAITGFELQIAARRSTFKLSQNKPAADRQGAVEGLECAGFPAIASFMRSLGQ